jgi:hypothetical protein
MLFDLEFELKLGDLGSAQFFSSSSEAEFTDRVGTKQNMAPEIWEVE